MINKNNPHTCYNAAVKVSETGEFKLIERISQLVKESNQFQSGLLIGIGDDAAAWKCCGKIQLCTTDCLIQDVHFDMKFTGWRELGWKSIAVNLSDIAAMGGIPRYALVSLAVPWDTEVEDILTLYEGMIEIANLYGVAIAGGNISASEKVVINITLHGHSEEMKLLSRSSARIGDVIAVTGFTGLSAAGFLMFKKQLSFNKEPSELFRGAHLKPVPRVKEGQTLIKLGVKTAIDISDGLLADLGHICDASNVSALIKAGDVPVNSALKNSFKDDYLSLALNGGEDYELLFTASPHVTNKVKSALNCPVTVIGEIIEHGSIPVKLTDSNGKEISVPGTGWNHFISK